jgi:hypothetical protein
MIELFDIITSFFFSEKKKTFNKGESGSKIFKNIL